MANNCYVSTDLGVQIRQNTKLYIKIFIFHKFRIDHLVNVAKTKSKHALMTVAFMIT